MKIIICLDERNGYMFNNRRQSKDGGLRKRLLSMLCGKKLWMSQYSKKQFEENGEIVVDDNYEENAGESDYCFVEDKGYSLDKCDEIWIFRWNKKYPFDKSFDVNLTDEGFSMEFSEKFCGTSHDEITLEVYKKS
jgi:hypothetical protein